jgi:predicted dehydrogenase
MNQIRWGILSTAKIGLEKVIPAIQEAENCKVTAIASRSNAKAQRAAAALNIKTFYGSYDELLADDSVDAIYNPLPNHLHIPRTIDALRAGKHVLCEKPIALNAAEVEKLMEVSKLHPQLKVMEAFMYRFHPQWIKVKSLVDEGVIGELTTIQSLFSYFNDNPDDFRNDPGMGGGGLMDIGCYCISLSRYLFGKEPQNIIGNWKIDPRFKVDYLTSGILDFGSGLATFSCATQTEPQQAVNITGTEGRIVISTPFNAPSQQKTTIRLFKNNKEQVFTFEPVNQYKLQVQKFTEAILSDSLQNMKAIDTLKKVCQSNNPAVSN